MEFCRIAPNVELGKDVKIHAFVNLYGCFVGDHTKIGSFVEIQKGAIVGKNCKISSLPDKIKYLDKLLSLNLSKNFLKSLPDEMIFLSNLEELNLEHNLFKSIPLNC